MIADAEGRLYDEYQRKRQKRTEAVIPHDAAIRLCPKETALYLDTHPNCRAALSYFRKNNARLAEVTAQYEAKYGPVTYYGQDCGEHWKWVDTPWPWEYSAEGCR